MEVDFNQVLVYDKLSGEVSWKISPTSNIKAGTVVKSLSSQGYFRVRYKGKLYQLHNVIWHMHTGSFPLNRIDHIDGNRTNNSLSNLRDVPIEDNNKNLKGYITNTTGFRGVYSGKAGHWYVRVGRTHIGTFKTFDLACQARLDAEAKAQYHPNHGRP